MDHTTMDSLYRQLMEQGIPVEKEEPMQKHTTFRIGGPADLFCSPRSEGQLTEAVRLAKELEIPVTVVSCGSNMLVADKGIRGLVLHVGEGLQEMGLVSSHIIRCGAGVTMANLCRFALEKGLTGLEFAFGIPGSAGGGAYMNAGAYGGEMSHVLSACNHVELDGTPGRLEGRDLDLSYRHSAYSSGFAVITSVEVSLRPGDPVAIKEAMDDYLGRRKSKQPLEWPSAGSVFKRPAKGYASALIDQCGLKGRRVGGAVVSPKHAGFIINDGGASCEDVCRLIEIIQEEVLRQCGIQLECEVKTIGQR